MQNQPAIPAAFYYASIPFDESPESKAAYEMVCGEFRKALSKTWDSMPKTYRRHLLALAGYDDGFISHAHQLNWRNVGRAGQDRVADAAFRIMRMARAIGIGIEIGLGSRAA